MNSSSCLSLRKTLCIGAPGGGAARAELEEVRCGPVEVRRSGRRPRTCGRCVAPAIGDREEGKSGEVLAAPQCMKRESKGMGGKRGVRRGRRKGFSPVGTCGEGRQSCVAIAMVLRDGGVSGGDGGAREASGRGRGGGGQRRKAVEAREGGGRAAWLSSERIIVFSLLLLFSSLVGEGRGRWARGWLLELWRWMEGRE